MTWTSGPATAVRVLLIWLVTAGVLAWADGPVWAGVLFVAWAALCTFWCIGEMTLTARKPATPAIDYTYLTGVDVDWIEQQEALARGQQWTVHLSEEGDVQYLPEKPVVSWHCRCGRTDGHEQGEACRSAGGNGWEKR